MVPSAAPTGGICDGDRPPAVLVFAHQRMPFGFFLGRGAGAARRRETLPGTLMLVPDSGAARDVAAAAGFTAFAGSVLLHHGTRGAQQAHGTGWRRGPGPPGSTGFAGFYRFSLLGSTVKFFSRAPFLGPEKKGDQRI